MVFFEIVPWLDISGKKIANKMASEYSFSPITLSIFTQIKIGRKLPGEFQELSKSVLMFTHPRKKRTKISGYLKINAEERKNEPEYKNRAFP